MLDNTPPKPPASGAVRIRAVLADSGAPPTVRLNKRMADLGLCSRREADDWIARGWVRVNGLPAVIGQPVAINARMDGDRLAHHRRRAIDAHPAARNPVVGLAARAHAQLGHAFVQAYRGAWGGARHTGRQGGCGPDADDSRFAWSGRERVGHTKY